MKADPSWDSLVSLMIVVLSGGWADGIASRIRSHFLGASWSLFAPRSWSCCSLSNYGNTPASKIVWLCSGGRVGKVSHTYLPTSPSSAWSWLWIYSTVLYGSGYDLFSPQFRGRKLTLNHTVYEEWATLISTNGLWGWWHSLEMSVFWSVWFANVEVTHRWGWTRLPVVLYVFGASCTLKFYNSRQSATVIVKLFV